MGNSNNTSSNSGQTRPVGPLTRRSMSGPTAEDYKAYVDDLSELQKFLNEKFVAGHLRNNAVTGQFDAEYLNALKIKLQQLRNVRRLVESRRGRAAGNIPPTLTRLLDALEPQCQRAVDELTSLQQLRSSLAEPSVVQVPDNPAAATDTEDEMRGDMNQDLTTSAEPTSSSAGHTSADDTPVLLAADNNQISNVADAEEDDQVQMSDADEDTSDDNSSHNTSMSGDSSGFESLDVWADEVKAQCDDTRPARWTVDRKANDFVESVFAEYEKVQKRDRVLRRPLDVTFEGEAGVDSGGLTKEFFHLAFEAVISRTYKDCQMFEGSRGHLIPSAAAEHLVNGYKYIGMMIVHAVKNDCRGLPGLSPSILHYIAQGDGPASIDDMAHLVTIDDVADTGLKNLLVKLNNTETLTDADNELLMSWMERCNCRLLLKENTRQLISQSILINYVFNCRIVQIEAIAKGMDMFGLRDFLRQNPSEENVSFVFPSVEEVEVTPEMLTAVTVVGMTSDSTDAFHEETFDFFQLFLHELYDGQIANKKLSDFIQFVSGTPYLPAQLILTFSTEIVYPVAHACFNQLDLPTRHQEYSAFRDAVCFALQHGTAFTTE